MPKDNKSDFEETNMKDYEEQYEEFSDEQCSGQNPVEKAGFNRNGQ